MTDDLRKDLTPRPGENIDPVELARRDQKKGLPRRFWKHAGVEEADGLFALTLDGRRARTPAQNALAVHSRDLAQAMAAEWDAQGEFVDPSAMPLTRIVNSALDGVAREMDATLDEVVKYAGSDLLVYRSGDPANLVAEQAAAWDPVLEWARARHGARFVLSEGVTFVTQPEASIEAMRRAFEAVAGAGPGAALRLAGLHVMTTLTGSALLALAVAEGYLDAAAAWKAAHVDEDFQMRAWGEDAEAMARRARRWREMEAAAKVVGR
ncbi:MAG: ATP12 family chaperone protein [Beijerinckiaceae bacterium]